MKKIILLCLVVAVGGGAFLAYRLTRPDHYGAPFKGAPAATAKDLLDGSDRYLAADSRVEGKIVRQCPSTGCWFDLETGDGRQLHIEMSHLGITMPQKGGRTAVVEGRLTKVDDKNVEFIGNGVEFR